jgi:hypothetical protein
MMDLKRKAVALSTVAVLDLAVLLFAGWLLFALAVVASAPLAFAVLFRL